MAETTNNQQRTLFKTKPNKAKVNIGKIGTEWQRHIVNCIPRRSAPLCLSAFVAMNQLFKTKPNKANFRKAQMNVKSLITKDYRKHDALAVKKS